MIRAATAADFPAFSALFRELGVDDPTPSAERWTTDLMAGTLISDRDGRVEGYVNFYTLNQTGYVRNLVVAPEARNAGIGATLLRAAAARLRSCGVADWHLNVKADNAPAIHLYEKLGMRVEHRSCVLRVPWSCAGALPAEPAIVLPVSPDEDDDLERALGLLGGRIAMLRLRAGRVLVQLRDETLAPVGFAAFDPEFPGANTFRIARPALAGTLLAALRPHARHDYLQVVAENDDDLAESLTAAGSLVKLRLLHLRGPLPA